MTPSPSALGSVVGMFPLGGPFFQPGWLTTPSPSFSQVGLVPAPWSSTSTPGKVTSVWDKIIPKAPLAISTVARPLSALRTTPAVSVCPAVPALVAATSHSISVLGVTAPTAVDVAPAYVARVPPVVPAAALGEELLEPFQKDCPLGKKVESLTLASLFKIKTGI